MAFTIKRDGYGQVEDNHLSAKRSGHVYAQLPADKSIDILENGQFVKYDYAAGKCAFSGNGPWYMVYNEEKLYDERKQMHKHFALKREDFYDKQLVPRVVAVELGDLWTTNMVAEGDYTVGQKLAPNAQGVLADAPDGFIQVVKCYQLPDGQNAVKLQVVANQ